MEEQEIELKIINMADIQSQKIEWLWYPFIPYGKLTIIQGDPGDGKTTFNNSKSFKLGKSEIDINLSKDAVLVCAWSEERFINALLKIGKNVGNKFEYKKINHMATYIYPLGLAIVYNGNHSILSGILKGEGVIQANQTYDLEPTYDYMYFDGVYFRNKDNDEVIYKVRRFEIGILYEIGRLLAENGIR